MIGIFCIALIGVLIVISTAVTPFDTHALTLQDDIFVKQHLPASVLYSGSTHKLGDTITAKMIYPDGATATVSDIFVTKQGLYASGFYLYKFYPVGEYTIQVLDDSENQTVKFHIKRLEPKLLHPQTTSCQNCNGGTVTRIIDAFTLDIDTTRIRLALVDGAKQGQPRYEDAVSFTASMCPIGTIALFDPDTNQDKKAYGIVVAEVFCSNTSLNQALLKNNHATIRQSLCDTSRFALTWGNTTCNSYGNNITNVDLPDIIRETDKIESHPELQVVTANKTMQEENDDTASHNLPPNDITVATSAFNSVLLDDTLSLDYHTMQAETPSTLTSLQNTNPFDPDNYSITLAQIIVLIAILIIICIIALLHKNTIMEFAG